jgi:hypothetical protein
MSTAAWAASALAGIWVLVTAAAPVGGYGANTPYDHDFDGLDEYAIAVGAFSIILSLVGLMMSLGKGPDGDRTLIAVRGYNITVSLFLALSLALWNGAGAGITTWFDPFKPPEPAAGNGYFAVWLGFLIALSLLSTEMSKGSGEEPSAKESDDLKSYSLPLFVCALILMLDSIKPVNEDFKDTRFKGATDDYKTRYLSYAYFAMAAAVTTLIVTGLILTGAEVNKAASQALIPMLALLWTAVAGILTFSNESNWTGINNGFFAAWAGASVAASMLLGGGAGFLSQEMANFRIFAIGIVVLVAAYFAKNGPAGSWGLLDKQKSNMVYKDNIVPDDQAYLISVGAVSAILALFVYLCGKSLCCLSPDTLNKVLFSVGGEDMTVTLLIAQFLFVWTGAGAIVATFGVPGGGCFSEPSKTANGYFAVWMLLGAAVSNLTKAMPDMAAKGSYMAAKGSYTTVASSVEIYYLPLLLCSVVGIGAIFDEDSIVELITKGSDSEEYGEYVYALCVFSVTAFCCLYSIVLEKPPFGILVKIFKMLVFFMWLSLTGVLTWRTGGTYTAASNGFFALYFGLFSSLRLSMSLLDKPDTEPVGDTPPWITCCPGAKTYEEA